LQQLPTALWLFHDLLPPLRDIVDQPGRFTAGNLDTIFTCEVNMLNLQFWRTPLMKTSLQTPDTGREGSLARAQVGRMVKVTGFGKLSPAYRQHLQAYGLLPGRSIQVLAQRPVTIILVEQTELAFETEIASQVWIE
jgi:Fe2+ transport system protein FeoA